MSKRLFWKASKGSAVAKAYYDSEYGECVVRLWCNGKERKNASYFTDSKGDAVATGKRMLESGRCGTGFGGICRKV